MLTFAVNVGIQGVWLFSWWFYFFYPRRLLFAIYIDISILFVRNTVSRITLIRVETPQKSDFRPLWDTEALFRETVAQHDKALLILWSQSAQWGWWAHGRLWQKHTAWSGRKVDPGFFNPSSGSKSSVTFSQSKATFLPKIKDKIDRR